MSTYNKIIIIYYLFELKIKIFTIFINFENTKLTYYFWKSNTQLFKTDFYLYLKKT